MMPHQVPLISLDWLGCFLASACMLEVIWLFNYGEYYHWYDSTLWCAVLCMLPLTILITIGRLTHIRHPYLEPWIFRRWRLYPILGMFLVAEVMNATPQVLQNTLTGGVLGWGFTTTSDSPPRRSSRCSRCWAMSAVVHLPSCGAKRRQNGDHSPVWVSSTRDY